MTALAEYQRLECPALWRDSPGGQRRGVVIALGDNSLVISDERSGRALTHWSLPAIRRMNPGAHPALYAPDEEADEQLEIDEVAMIAALDKVQAIISSRRPHPGRLRSSLLALSVAAVAGLAFFWLPGAMTSHTATVLPFSKRVGIGRNLLADVTRITGSACSTRLGDAALAHLAQRLAPGAGLVPTILVMPEGIGLSRHLPGGLVLVDRRVLESSDSPDMLAGVVLAERLRAGQSDPVVDLLRHAGLAATFRLLTTGDLPESALRGYAEILLTRPLSPVDPGALVARFAAAGVSSSAYAEAIDPSGETVAPLIDQDPGQDSAKGPVMNDEDWVALQGICG